MVLNKRVEFEVSELLANARETVAKLENTTAKMQDIISEDTIQTRSPTATRDRRSSVFVNKLIAFLLVWVVGICSFLSISFYYFTQHIHDSVEVLTKQVVDIQKAVATPVAATPVAPPQVIVTWPAGNLPPPTDSVSQPSHSSTK
jgi:hypothetical protein